MLNINLIKNLSDEELIHYLDEAASQSPVISILCERLNEAIAVPTVATNNKSQCPVCLADLVIDLSDNNEHYEVKVDKH